MLQSPKKRIQRQRRLTIASENPILEAKHDNRQRTNNNSNNGTQHATPSRQRVVQKRQQHRRHLSAPDEAQMLGSASPRYSTSVHPARTKDFSFDVDSESRIRQHLTTNNDNINNFLLQQHIQRPRTPPQQQRGKPTPITPSRPYVRFPDSPGDPGLMIDELLSNAESPTPRRNRLPPNSSPLRTTFRADSFSNPSTRPYDNFLPSPPHSAPLHSISTFDLALLPHPSTYISMSTLSMPAESDGDGEKYYSPASSAMSPPHLPSAPSTPEMKHLPMYALPAISEISVPDMTFPTSNFQDMLGDPVENSQNLSPVSERGPLQDAKSSGITNEEISSFISGPELSDGKWVCLYPECNKRFGRKENIKSHVQTHLGDRQYQCPACRKCFVRQHDLKRHSKIHTGAKPYPCLCGNSFARHDALTRHRQRGMCIGAFEGIVKKVAKRGRPRKRPLREGEETRTSKNPQNSMYSGSGSDASTHADEELGSPQPETPNFDMSSTPSLRGYSPELHQQRSSDASTPPTSPPEHYNFDTFVSSQFNRLSSTASDSLPDDDDGEYINFNNFGSQEDAAASLKKLGYGSPPVSEYISGGGELGLFGQDGADDDMLGLTALERNPSILDFERIYIKPEMLLSGTEQY